MNSQSKLNNGQVGRDDISESQQMQPKYTFRPPKSSEFGIIRNNILKMCTLGSKERRRNFKNMQLRRVESIKIARWT